jgi:hypothetical protein
MTYKKGSDILAEQAAIAEALAKQDRRRSFQKQAAALQKRSKRAAMLEALEARADHAAAAAANYRKQAADLEAEAAELWANYGIRAAELRAEAADLEAAARAELGQKSKAAAEAAKLRRQLA